MSTTSASASIEELLGAMLRGTSLSSSSEPEPQDETPPKTQAEIQADAKITLRELFLSDYDKEHKQKESTESEDYSAYQTSLKAKASSDEIEETPLRNFEVEVLQSIATLDALGRAVDLPLLNDAVEELTSVIGVVLELVRKLVGVKSNKELPQPNCYDDMCSCDAMYMMKAISLAITSKSDTPDDFETMISKPSTELLEIGAPILNELQRKQQMLQQMQEQMLQQMQEQMLQQMMSPELESINLMESILFGGPHPLEDNGESESETTTEEESEASKQKQDAKRALMSLFFRGLSSFERDNESESETTSATDEEDHKERESEPASEDESS